jgi:predicted DNA-binding transcriptional regulator AlpA
MSEHQFNNKLNEIADNMGIAMYQRFSLQEGALFLRCSAGVVKEIVADQKIQFIELPDNQIEFFGFQLLEYLLGCVSGGQAPTPKSSHPDKIIRTKEALELSGLSRTTLWRLEKKGQFPARLPLSAGSVGWRLREVQHWIAKR